MTSPRIGYIGLGALGSAIFPNIVGFAEHNSLPAPAVWNRSQDKYAAVKEAHPNVYTATEVEELVPRCDLIFTCLVNDAAAEEVYGKLVAALQKEKVREGGNKVFADQTTLKASTARECRAGRASLAPSSRSTLPCLPAALDPLTSSPNPRPREERRGHLPHHNGLRAAPGRQSATARLHLLGRRRRPESRPAGARVHRQKGH
jgi:hypothetical protein